MPLSYDTEKNKMYDFTLLSTGGRRQFDTSEIVDRYDHRIASTWLADFLTLGQGKSGRQGTGAQSKNKTDMFAVAVIGILDLVTSEVNRKAAPDLLAFNQLPGAAILKHGEISKGDILELAQAIQAVATVGMLTPDTNTEANIREELSLPPQLGQNMDDLNDGGEASAGESGNDPAQTRSRAPAAGQGQGQGGDAGDGGDPPVKPRPVGKRRSFSRFRQKSGGA
jgi:hypothetical protein